MIVETRLHPRLFPILLHFSSVLGPRWPVHIYTTSEVIEAASKSASMNRSIESGLIKALPRPPGTSFPNRELYSEVMASHWIWDALAPAEHVLVFQSDSIICANAP